jgi:AraC family ethanolamine operon transcriptional activator
MTQSAKIQGNPSAFPGTSGVGKASACDPVLHEQMVRPWDLCHMPREPGEFGYRMRYLRIPGITLYRETFDLHCCLQGLSPVDTFAFSLPTRVDSSSTYWGSSLYTPGMPAMLSGALDVKLERGHEQLVVLIDASLMRSHLPEEMVKSLEVAAATHLLPAGREDIRYLENWFDGLIDRAIQLPEMLHHPAVLQSIIEDIFQHLTAAVSISMDPPSRPSRSLRRKGLERALEYLRQTGLENPSIPEISRAAGVSQRTLEYAFRAAFGLTPLGFLKIRRMHGARRDLLFTNSEQATVMAIACRHGFYHPARFAKDYRQIFGELPSVTLQRSSRSMVKELSPLLG